ncbi:hypothetical protein FNO01nite_30290 [Flavobacterium noncentrifugens]|nr:hypothetical protein [Flavobacterium noncentrifugens]GEP52357.1 hypothetical protein FNO01nite_30290 [Flavobacterium noncentrifugens]
MENRIINIGFSSAVEAGEMFRRLAEGMGLMTFTAADLSCAAENAKINFEDIAKALNKLKVKQIEPPRNVIPERYLRGANNFKK